MTISRKEPVSIILPTYNRAASVGRAVESVLRQTYPYFELLVIDDGSTDDTERIIREYGDKRIKYYKLLHNEGQSKARNIGMDLAQYEFLAFEDSDDLWRPQKLEKQMEMMQAAGPEVGLVYHKFRYDMGSGKGIIMPDERIAVEKKSGNIYTQLLWDNLIGMPTILMRKECIQSVGKLDETLKCLEDYDFVLRIAKKYEAVFVDEIYVDAMFSNDGVSGMSYQYLVASCMLLQKYKDDYLAAKAFNHRVEIILRDAGRLGITEQIVRLLERLLQI